MCVGDVRSTCVTANGAQRIGRCCENVDSLQYVLCICLHVGVRTSVTS